MQLRGKQIRDISEQDILDLVENRVPESRHLDYKRDLPGRTDDEKREFLADVSAFANTGGGVIVYGIEATKSGPDAGLPESIVGISGVSGDQFALWASSILRDGLSPRLTDHHLKEITVTADAGHQVRVIVLGIPQSIIGPHCVLFKNSGRFFRRGTADKYQADVDEIRRMFLRTADTRAELDVFRRERLRIVREESSLANIDARFGTFVHVLPIGRLSERVDLRPRMDWLRGNVGPVGATGWDYRFSSDGLMLYPRTDPDGKLRSFAQWLHNGGFEVFTDRFHRGRGDAAATSNVYFARGLADWGYRQLPTVLSLIADRLEVPGPYAVALGITGIRGRFVHDPSIDDVIDTAGDRRFDRDPLMPSVEIIESVADFESAYGRLMDAVWHSAGFSGAPHSRW